MAKIILNGTIQINIDFFDYALDKTGNMSITAISCEDPILTFEKLIPLAISTEDVDVGSVTSVVTYLDDENNPLFSDTTHVYVFESARINYISSGSTNSWAALPGNQGRVQIRLTRKANGTIIND